MSTTEDTSGATSPPTDLLSGEADAAIPESKIDSFTIDDDDDDKVAEEEGDVPTPLKERKTSTGSQKQHGKSGAKMAKLSDKTSKIMSDYQAYLQEIETEFPSDKSALESISQTKDAHRDNYSADFTPVTDLVPGMNKDHDPEKDMPLRRGWDYDEDEEVGGTPHFGEQLVSRGQKYTLPFLHSRRSRRAACCMVLTIATVIIIGVSVSSTQKKKTDNLPDWEGMIGEEEQKNEQQQQQQQQQQTPQSPGETTTPHEPQPQLPNPNENPYINDPNYQADMSYQFAAMTYQPKFFDRTDNIYTGDTYLAALEFCENVEGYGLCPFAAICPLGVGTNPIGGIKLGGPSWAPVSDRVDEWVQLGNTDDDKCHLYSNVHGKTPEWGTYGGNDYETRNLVCCRQVDSGIVPPAPPVATSTGSDSGSGSGSGATDTSNSNIAPPTVYTPPDPSILDGSGLVPIEFDRNKGWMGQTYAQAIDFCQQKGYLVCPYSVICPDGAGHAPSGGLKPGAEEGQWVPMIDAPDWAQVGAATGIPCNKWSTQHPEFPSWAETGEGNEEFTRHIYCCSEGTGTGTAATSPATVATIKNPIEPQSPQDESNTAVSVPQMGNPQSIQWYDRSSGWKGQTYTEAYLFCLNQNQALPCPYEVICPYGEGAPPAGGYRYPSGSWVPMKESEQMEDDNAWVGVSSDISCSRYDRLHAGPPDWGETGEGNEELTRNIACCHDSPPATIQATPNQPTESAAVDLYEEAKEVYDPKWFDRSEGWSGQTYFQAEQFCNSKSRALCPIQAVCPLGKDNLPFGGPKDGVSWVATDTYNFWLQVGLEESCKSYADLFPHPSPDWGLTGKDNESITRNIVCCKSDSSSPVPVSTAAESQVAPKPMPTAAPIGDEEVGGKWDQLAKQTYDPKWLGPDDGYISSTHLHAQMFCKANNRVLCPVMAYCPMGNLKLDNRSPLLMGLPRFLGEAWAPVGETLDFIMVGTFQNDESTTCETVASMNKGKLPENLPELGTHVLCCISAGEENPSQACGGGLKNNGVCSGMSECCSKNGFCAQCDRVAVIDKEEVVSEEVIGSASAAQEETPSGVVLEMADKYGPVWFGRNNGWMGGSYNDAVTFCSSERGSLCPFEVYCPQGGSKSVMSGYPADFGTDVEHYSPIAEFDNHWVNVGMRNGDPETTCRGYSEMYKELPSWGLSSERSELKKYVMCCMSGSGP